MSVVSHETDCIEYISSTSAVNPFHLAPADHQDRSSLRHSVTPTSPESHRHTVTPSLGLSDSPTRFAAESFTSSPARTPDIQYNRCHPSPALDEVCSAPSGRAPPGRAPPQPTTTHAMPCHADTPSHPYYRSKPCAQDVLPIRRVILALRRREDLADLVGGVSMQRALGIGQSDMSESVAQSKLSQSVFLDVSVRIDVDVQTQGQVYVRVRPYLRLRLRPRPCLPLLPHRQDQPPRQRCRCLPRRLWRQYDRRRGKQNANTSTSTPKNSASTHLFGRVETPLVGPLPSLETGDTDTRPVFARHVEHAEDVCGDVRTTRDLIISWGHMIEAAWRLAELGAAIRLLGV